jgi:hypothetical protein
MALTKVTYSMIKGAAFNVLDYGATGNGSTDDTVAILAALTAANAAGGGTVYFPAGTYIFPSNLTVTSFNNIALQGAGQGNTVLKTTIAPATPAFGTALIISFISCSYISVQDITFDFNSILPTNSNCCAFGFVFGSHFYVNNCAVINGRQNGIGFNQVQDFTVTNCYLQRAGGAIGSYQNEAIIVSAGSAQAVKNGHIANNTITGWGTLFSGLNLLIANNIISTWGYGGGITINSDAYTNNAILIGNVCKDSTGLDANATYPAGIECWAPQSIIQGNYCYNNSSGGIAFGGDKTIVTNNVCGNNGNSTTGVGIAQVSQAGWTAASNCIVSNNVCFDTGAGNQDYGFGQGNASTGTFANTQVFNNNFFNNVVGDVQFGTYSTQNQFTGYVYENSATYDAASIANGASNTGLNITVAGANLGDFVQVSCSITLAGLFVTGYVSSTNAVQVVISNLTGGAIDLASATYRVRVSQKRP